MTPFKKANQLLKEMKYEEAIILYKECIFTNLSFFPAYHNLAYCYKKSDYSDLYPSVKSIGDILSGRKTEIYLSIIIPGYNNSSSIIRLLDNLSYQTKIDFEVLVVSDGCEEVVKNIASYVSQFTLKIYNTNYNDGFGVMLARNLGAAKSQGKILAFIDPDVILPNSFVEELIKNFEENCLIIPKVHFVDEKNHEKIILRENRKGFKDPNSQILGFATQCCAISRYSFIALGGFDEKLTGQGGSDTDFGLRHASKYNNAKYLNEVVCYHIGLSSGKKYHVGEKSKWERKTYNYRKKVGFYDDPTNSTANGGLKHFLNDKWESFKNLYSGNACFDLLITTVISDLENYGYKNYLKPSAIYYDLEIKTLIADENKISRKAGSLSEKDRLLLNLIDKIDSNSVVMFLDGYDTVISSEKEEILNKFFSFNAPLVVSAELNCHPDIELASKFPDTEYGAKYLNTGGFIGYAWAIKKMIRKARKVSVPNIKKLQLSNQYRWIRVFLEDSSIIKLDNSSKIFFSASTSKENREYKRYSNKYSHSLYSNEEFSREEMNRIFNMMKKDGSRAIVNESSEKTCVVHWNGPASLFMERFSNSFSFLRPWEK